MSDTISQVFEAFGNELPTTRSAYSATSKKPFPVLRITKEFKTWAKFKAQYDAYAIAKRNKAAAEAVVTKKKVVETKDVVKKK